MPVIVIYVQKYVYYNYRHVDDVDLYVGAISEHILQLPACI
jgi:hypothetical protein